MHGDNNVKYIVNKLAHLSKSERKIIEPVLWEYADLFHDDEDNDFKSTNVVEHRIETGDAAPIRKHPHHIPFAFRDEIDRQGK
jgi:hypothetical protein